MGSGYRVSLHILSLLLKRKKYNIAQLFQTLISSWGNLNVSFNLVQLVRYCKLKKRSDVSFYFINRFYYHLFSLSVYLGSIRSYCRIILSFYFIVTV